MLCFARCDLFFVFNFHSTNSLEHVLIPVYPDSKELHVVMSSDDEKYGGFGAVQHMTYPVKEFDGKRYVELYIPARTAIVLQEVKEPPKKKTRKSPAKKTTARKAKKEA